MSHHEIFNLIIIIVVVNFVFERFMSFINIKNLKSKLPKEAEGIYDEEKYSRSQQYIKKKEKFSLITSSFSFLLLLSMLFFDGFSFIDIVVRDISNNSIVHALLFFGILFFAYSIISIPFEIYSTFVIEQKFGFNKTTPLLFFTDKLKSWILVIIIGGILFSLITWIYLVTGVWFVVVTLAVITAFSVFMSMFYTQLIVPIFNKLSPLKDGELKTAIENFSEKANFPLTNISVIDNSKRSTKSNAYFTGLGKKKRIVLFDTLIEKHTTDELVAVLAHEIGHYKKKHIQIGLIISIIQTAIMLSLLYVVLGFPVFQEAIGAYESSFYMGILVFGLLYTPLSIVLGIIESIISRKNEYSADAFATKYKLGQALQDALKKLSSDNLSNLTPHPWYVFVYYSHPPVLDRLKEIEKFKI